MRALHRSFQILHDSFFPPSSSFLLGACVRIGKAKSKSLLDMIMCDYQGSFCVLFYQYAEEMFCN